jgi:L-seryl-tRNA(Ser) seleniumtransferase
LTLKDRKNLRFLPAVERVLNLPDVVRICTQYGRATVTAWVRDVLGELRNSASDALSGDAADVERRVVERLGEVACDVASQRLRKVINGTGVLIHTNLGRAPLAQAAVDAIVEAAGSTNLEVDLQTGQRGRRGARVESLCCDVTKAEAALVVNNCAAATLLTLQTLAAGRQVVISRGQLIEIGGSFRLPDVFRQAGVQLCEVGTTNRTRLSDYAAAIGPETAALLRVHPSNYRMSGFCESVAIDELAKLGKSRGLAVIDDVGSGCLCNASRYFGDEPVVSDSLCGGADVVLFSGDKLLGGPQCGIIVGRTEIIKKLRSNPLARALRVDKLTLAALQATLEIHRAGRAFDEIPVLKQLSLSNESIRTRAERIVERLRAHPPADCVASIEAVASMSGGGTLADEMMPSWAVALACASANQTAMRLRLGEPAILSRVQEKRVLIDLRTVMPEDDDAVIECVRSTVVLTSNQRCGGEPPTPSASG